MSTSTGVEIYAMPISSPCRLVTMTAEFLGIDYKYNTVDLFKGEHMKPEFIKVCLKANNVN